LADKEKGGGGKKPFTPVTVAEKEKRGTYLFFIVEGGRAKNSP